MLNKIILFLLCFGITVNCLASSPDAWEEFRDEVTASCEKAAPEVLRLDDYSITADPFGSESYGMAIMRGKTPEKADVFHICVYDKGSRKAEVGSEISSEPEHPKVSLIKGPRLDDVRGLDGINGSTRYPIRDHEKYLPNFTASLKVTTSSNPKVTDMTSLGGGFGKSVTMKGGITDAGNVPVVVYGFVYASHSSPTVWDNLVPAGDLAGTITVGKFFTAKVEYVPSGSYHFKAFAYSNEALGYGEDQNFSARQIRDDAHFVSYGEEFTFVISDESSAGGLLGDVNGDGQTDIADAVLALQIAAGITPVQQIRLSGDVNGDSRIGMEEAAYILQKMDVPR